MIQEPRKPPVSGPWGKMFAIGLDFSLSLVLTFLAGTWLDKKLGTTPWMMLLGLVLGVGAGIKLLIERTKTPSSSKKPSDQGTDEKK